MAFGEPINLHLFRDIAATTIATRDPAHVGIARDLLAHGDLRSLERHYIQADQTTAARTYQTAIKAERALISERRQRPT